MPLLETNKYIVYILECSDKSFYTGITNNLEKRLKTHNSGKASKYTRVRLPVKLLKTFIVENKSDALKLEIKIKKMSRAQKLNLINNTV